MTHRGEGWLVDHASGLWRQPLQNSFDLSEKCSIFSDMRSSLVTSVHPGQTIQSCATPARTNVDAATRAQIRTMSRSSIQPGEFFQPGLSRRIGQGAVAPDRQRRAATQSAACMTFRALTRFWGLCCPWQTRGETDGRSHAVAILMSAATDSKAAISDDGWISVIQAISIASQSGRKSRNIGRLYLPVINAPLRNRTHLSNKALALFA